MVMLQEFDMKAGDIISHGIIICFTTNVVDSKFRSPENIQKVILTNKIYYGGENVKVGWSFESISSMFACEKEE